MKTAEQILQELIDLQEKKVLNLANRLVPGATLEDIRNPHDFPALRDDPDFNFEDGILAGLLSARMALRANLTKIH